MKPIKFLFVSLDGLIGDIAWQIAKEGHNVKYFIESAEEKEVSDGFVPKVNDWQKEVDWADVPQPRPRQTIQRVRRDQGRIPHLCKGGDDDVARPCALQGALEWFWIEGQVDHCDFLWDDGRWTTDDGRREGRQEMPGLSGPA